jgi:predicted RNA-binding Zn-ribbon protein involved in translation (DUF1610 family)
MKNFKYISDFFCPYCGKKTMYEDISESSDYHQGQASYCKACGAGGYIIMGKSLGKKKQKELEELGNE